MFLVYIETPRPVIPGTDGLHHAIEVDISRIAISCNEIAREFVNFLEEQLDVTRVVLTEVTFEDVMTMSDERKPDELVRTAIFMERFFEDKKNKSMW